MLGAFTLVVAGALTTIGAACDGIGPANALGSVNPAEDAPNCF